jgi:hypothetical protein
MGDRAVDCARLESVCAERHRGFESPPIRIRSDTRKVKMQKPPGRVRELLSLPENGLLARLRASLTRPKGSA